MQRTLLIRSIERLCFTAWNSYAQSLLNIYWTVTCVLLDCLSLVEENYYLKRVQHKVIKHRWMLMLLICYYCFKLCFISVNKVNAEEVAFADDFTVAGKLFEFESHNQSNSNSINWQFSSSNSLVNTRGTIKICDSHVLHFILM